MWKRYTTVGGIFVERRPKEAEFLVSGKPRSFGGDVNVADLSSGSIPSAGGGCRDNLGTFHSARRSYSAPLFSTNLNVS